MNEEVICPACNNRSSSFKKKYPGEDSEKLLGIDSVFECPQCGLAFAWPMPIQKKLSEYYSDGIYWNHHANPSCASHIHSLSQAIARAIICAKWLNRIPKNILDVGAGYGWQADGVISVFGNCSDSNYWYIEPDDNASKEIARRVNGIHPSRISDISAGQEYDLIFANHVLEHVSDPNHFLKLISENMTSGGYIYIEVPNRDDVYKQDVFPHTLFYSRESLRNQLESLGFKVVLLDEFGASPNNSGINFIYRLGFKLSTKLRIRSIALMLDKMMWKYQSLDNGIWLRALAKKVNSAWPDE